MRDYRGSVITGHRRTDAGQSDPYVPLCFAGDTKTEIVLSLHIKSNTLNIHQSKAVFSPSYQTKTV